MLLTFVIFVAILGATEAQFYPRYDFQICSGLSEFSVIGIRYECHKYYYCYRGIAYLDDCRNICKGCQFDFKINDCNAEANVKCSPMQIQSNLPVVQTPTNIWMPTIQNLQYLPWLSQLHNQQNPQWTQNMQNQQGNQKLNQAEQNFQPIFQVDEMIKFEVEISPISNFESISTAKVIESKPTESSETCQLNFNGFHPDRFIHLLCPNISFEANISYNEFSRTTEGTVQSHLTCDFKFNCMLSIELSPCALMRVDLPSKIGVYEKHVVTVKSNC